MSRLLALTIVAILSCASNLFAQLTWSQRDLEVKPELGARSIPAQYAFTNSGQYAVTITAVHPSCSCTAAKLTKKVYKPGESGVLVVTFTPGPRQGVQQKQILIETDETSNNQTVLLLRANILPLLSVDHPVVYWTVGDQPKPQMLVISMARPAKLLAVRSGSGVKVETSIKEVKAGEKYEVELTPDTLSKPAMSQLEFVTDLPAGSPIARVHLLISKDRSAANATTQPNEKIKG